MLKYKTVVVPAYKEENQIVHVIETMPKFVDRILVVNDNSSGATADIVKQHMEQDGQKVDDLPTVLNAIRHKPNNNIFKLETVQ
jgi:glycosyltransferase involved in cell wall biosynthesis